MVAFAIFLGLACSPAPPASYTTDEPLSGSERYSDYLTDQGIYVAHDGGIGEPTLLELLADDGIGPIGSVSIHGQHLTARSVEALMSAEATAQLKHLSLQGSRIGDAGLAALATAPRLASLEYIILQDVEATATGVAALAASPHLKAKSLAIGWQAVGDAGAAAFVDAAGVQSLNLDSARVGGEGARALLERGQTPAISLASNPIQFSTLRAISPAIQSVSLNDCDLDASTIAALARAEGPGLKTLSLERVKLTDDGLRDIMNASWFTQLDALSLGGHDTSPEVRRALKTAFKGSFLSMFERDL